MKIITTLLCLVAIGFSLYVHMNTERSALPASSENIPFDSDLSPVGKLSQESKALNGSIEFVAQGLCISPLPVNVPLQNALNTQIHSYIFDQLLSGSPYRSLSIGLSSLGIPAGQVLNTQVDLVHSQLSDDIVSNAFKNGDVLARVSANQTIDSLTEGTNLNAVEKMIQTGLINDQIGLYFYDEQQIALSSFGVVFLYYLQNTSMDEVSTSLKVLSHGYQPSNYDILTFMFLGMEQSLINTLIQELVVNSSWDINTIVSVPGYGNQNILSAAIQLQNFSTLSMALENGAFFMTWSATKTLKESIKNYPNEVLYDIFRARLTPLRERDAKRMLNTLSAMTLPDDLINLAQDMLSFESSEIPSAEKQHIESVRVAVSLIIFREISAYYKDLTRDCFNRLANNFIGLIDWRHKNVKEFLKDIETEPVNLEEIVIQHRTFTPSVSFPQNEGKDEQLASLYPKTRIDLDFTKEELLNIAAFNKSKSFDDIDSLIAEKDYGPKDQDAILFKLMLAILGDHENRFVQLVPELEYLPQEFIAALLSFSNGISAASTLMKNGHDVGQSYSFPQTNLLIDSVSVGKFQLFSYLNSIRVPVRETAFSYDAIDYALIQLAREGDWRFLDALMQRNITISISNKQVLVQLKQHSPSLLLELESKYPMLKIE